MLGFVGASLCVNEYEGNYADNYDNEISQAQQEGEFCLSILLFLTYLDRWLIVKNLFPVAMSDFIKPIKSFLGVLIKNSSTHTDLLV